MEVSASVGVGSEFNGVEWTKKAEKEDNTLFLQVKKQKIK